MQKETSTTSIINCTKCNDVGYIFFESEGYTKAVMCECKKGRHINYVFKHSGIPVCDYKKKTLESFNVYDENTKKMKELALSFLKDESATGLGFFGKSGTGKTHLCIAVCGQLTKERLISHKYFAYRREMQQLKSSYYHHDEYEILMYKWMNCDVLLIDDLFKFAEKDGEIQTQDLQIMFEIINERYLNGKITIFSSEYSLKEITNIDEALGSRIYNIIGDYGVKCDGKNYRFKRRKTE